MPKGNGNGLPPPQWARAILDGVGTGTFGSLAEAQAHVDAKVAEYNATPQAALGGLSPNRMTELLYGDWQTTGALRVSEALTLAELEPAMVLHNARTLLGALRNLGPVRATQAGNLNRQFVSAMLRAMRWPERLVKELQAVTRVINEEDVLPVHVLRVLLELARLMRKRQGAFRLTTRGKEILAPPQAGQLYALLFRTTFRELNLDYLYRGWPNPAIQQTVGYTLYRLAGAAVEWRDTQSLAADVLLPEVRETAREPPYAAAATAGWQLWGRVLRPLGWFGLLEERRVKAAERFNHRIEVRKTPLFDRVLSFRFRS